MVISDSDKEKGRTSIGELEVNKETIQDLTDEQAGKVQGGLRLGNTDEANCTGKGRTTHCAKSENYCVTDACP